MSMAKRQFRTKQAIAAFEQCAQCTTLPENKRRDVANELNKARDRYAQQDAEVSFLCENKTLLRKYCLREYTLCMCLFCYRHLLLT